jgi:hypothetical protein
MAHSSPARGARIETRRAVLRRGARAALGGAATALLAACSSPVNIVVSSPTTTTVARTATPATPPTLQATSAPPQPRPAAPMGAGVNAGTPVGTPRIPEGFARAPLRVIHAAPALPVLTLLVDNVAVATLGYPEATAYVDVLYGSRRIAGVSPTGELFATTLDVRDEVAYTIVVATDGGNPRPIVLTDDQPAPASGGCHLRFLPLDPAAGPLDLAVVGGPLLTTGVAPFVTGPTVAVPAGSVGLEVRAAGQQAPLYTKPPLTLDAGDRYTAVLSGRAAAQTLRLLLYPDAAIR